MLVQVTIYRLTYYTNCKKIQLQTATADLLQIATRLLQIPIGSTNCDKFVSDSDKY